MIDFSEEDFEDGGNAETQTNPSDKWVDKYRPRTLDDMCLAENLKTKFKKQIESGNLMNACFVGPGGIGKTTLALILANSSKTNDTLFVSCASGEGKIEFIQSKIVPFCQSASNGRKIVILDELDSASSTQVNSFQKALRNVMEAYTDNITFIATGNYSQNILSPIVSRFNGTTELTFSPTDMVTRLIDILHKENIKIVNEPNKVKMFFGNLVRSCYPDMRMVIGKLQESCIGGELDINNIEVNSKVEIANAMSEMIEKINASVNPLEMRKQYNADVMAFSNSSGLASLCKPYEFAKAMFNHIVNTFNANADDLMALIDLMYRIENSADGETHLFGFLLKVKSMNLN